MKNRWAQCSAKIVAITAKMDCATVHEAGTSGRGGEDASAGWGGASVEAAVVVPLFFTRHSQ